MKRIVISICMFLFILFANQAIAQEKVKEKDNKTKIKDENGKMKIKNEGMNSTMPYAYTPNYSSNFVMGNPAHARMILDVWKDWDDNAFDRHNYMADTLTMILPDGSVTKGMAANLEGAKKYRGSLTSSKSTVDAWIPLRSTDRNEDWVAIWGNETDTHADGTVDKREIQEIWRINKDGKIDYMKQYSGKSPMPK